LEKIIMNFLGKNQNFVKEIISLIEQARQRVATTVNIGITHLYWKIGQRINKEILKDKRAKYGKQIVATLSCELTNQFGRGFEERNLHRMMQFAQMFNDEKILSTVSTELNWSHFVILTMVKDRLQREFYMQMCRTERWSVRSLQNRIDSMLFERTAISKKPEEFIERELKNLSDGNHLSPDLVFKDQYFLDFTGLKNVYCEKSLEDAVLRELESFIIELGNGFAFVERQKRMIIDGEDFYLDLLFFHRKLRRLVAIELKIGKFKAAYKGQMELYLRWLDKYEKQPDEQTPIGLILCAEGNHEQIEFLELEKSGIKIAEYITELPDKKLLTKKLHQAIAAGKKRFEKIQTEKKFLRS